MKSIIIGLYGLVLKGINMIRCIMGLENYLMFLVERFRLVSIISSKCNNGNKVTSIGSIIWNLYGMFQT